MPSDEDVFRELQNDALGKARLEEEAAKEMQAGWTEDREREIQALLDNRPQHGFDVA